MRIGDIHERHPGVLHQLEHDREAHGEVAVAQLVRHLGHHFLHHFDCALVQHGIAAAGVDRDALDPATGAELHPHVAGTLPASITRQAGIGGVAAFLHQPPDTRLDLQREPRDRIGVAVRPLLGLARPERGSGRASRDWRGGGARRARGRLQRRRLGGRGCDRSLRPLHRLSGGHLRARLDRWLVCGVSGSLRPSVDSGLRSPGLPAAAPRAARRARPGRPD